MKPIVVSDTSPIRALHHLEMLDLLTAFFSEVLIPPAVMHELKNTTVADSWSSFSFIRLQSPTNPESVGHFRKSLDAGESEALALALEIGAETVLMDERDARAEARSVGLVPVGAVGILLRARKAGLIAELAPMLDRLRVELRFFLSDALVAELLKDAGE